MKITLVLEEAMLQAIAEALANAPYRIAAPVLAEIQRQVNEQRKPPSPQE